MASIIWFVIAARKGEKKSAVLRRLRKQVQRNLQEEWAQENTDDKANHGPQLIVDHFSFEELHSISRPSLGIIRRDEQFLRPIGPLQTLLNRGPKDALVIE